MTSRADNVGAAGAAGLFLDGAEVPAYDGETFAVRKPEDGSVLGHAARGRAADVDRAVRSARRAFEAWSALPPGERERHMLRAADAIEANHARFVDLVIDESGSTIHKARYEASYAASLFRTAAGEARRLYGDTFPNDKPDRLSMVFREPLGVVAVVSPFNAPLALLAKMIAFPLAAGNAVVAKPSEETPLVAIELARVLGRAGFPAGLFNVVTGYGGEVGEPLVTHAGIDGIAFTGSTGTGIRIGTEAVRRMRRVQLELGGKNALLVQPDFDPARAADIAAHGGFYHAGQICMASSRVLVAREVADAFVEALVRKAESLHLGALRDEKTAYGPLIHEQALEKVDRHVRAAVDAGARLACGGRVKRGLVYEPTVLVSPPRTSDVWRDETFGPVIAVVPVSSLDEAITLANDSDYGLSAAILTRDVQVALTAARRLRAGSVHVGMHSFQSNALAPIGGFGMSGIGRSGGKYSTEEFTNLKWVSVELGTTASPF